MEDRSSLQGCVCVHIPKFVCLFVPGYSCMNTEARVAACSTGSVSRVSGFRSVWDYVVCVLGSDPRVYTSRGPRAGIHVCGLVLCGHLHAPACASVRTGVGKKCTRLCPRACADLCPQREIDLRPEAAVWQSCGGEAGRPWRVGREGLEWRRRGGPGAGVALGDGCRSIL